MRKVHTLTVLALLSATALAGCGSDEKSSSGGSQQCKPIKDGVLSVVTSLPGPNFWGSGEEDPDEIKSGIEFDLATLIAAKCGLTLSVRNEGWEPLVAGQVKADSYDIGLSQMTITEDREKVLDFSVPYFTSDQGLLVQTGTAVATWDDMKALTVGVQGGTTAEYYLTSGEVPGWQLDNVKSFPDLASTYAALNAGTVGGVLIDTPINLGQAAKSGGKLEVVAQFATGESYGAFTGNENGKKAIFDPIIQGFKDDGTITALIVKYLGGDPATVPFVEIPGS